MGGQASKASLSSCQTSKRPDGDFALFLPPVDENEDTSVAAAFAICGDKGALKKRSKLVGAGGCVNLDDMCCNLGASSCCKCISDNNLGRVKLPMGVQGSVYDKKDCSGKSSPLSYEMDGGVQTVDSSTKSVRLSLDVGWSCSKDGKVTNPNVKEQEKEDEPAKEKEGEGLSKKTIFLLMAAGILVVAVTAILFHKHMEKETAVQNILRDAGLQTAANR